jgi:DNA-binding transcriptional LysR family regulator
MIELSNVQCEEYIHEDKRRFGLMVASEWKHRQTHDYIMIKTEPSYLLVYKDHPFAARQSVSLRLLKNERVLTMDKTSYFQEDLNRAVEPYGFTIKPFYETADVAQQCGLVDKGKGVMICIRQILEESSCKNVVLVPLEERTFDYNVAFIFQDYDALDMAAKQFIAFVIENVRQDTA